MSNPLIRKIAGRGGIGFFARLLSAKSCRVKQFHSVPIEQKFSPLLISALPAPSIARALPPGAAVQWPCAFAIPPLGRRPSAFAFPLPPSVWSRAPPLRAPEWLPVSFPALIVAPVLPASTRPPTAFSLTGKYISPPGSKKNAVQGRKKSGATPRFPGNSATYCSYYFSDFSACI